MFEAINYLLHEKNKKELDVETFQSFNPFLASKVFSYYDSGKYCNYINDTLNVYSGIFKTKEDEFNFFDVIIPKLKRRKSEYIKQVKVEDEVKETRYIPEFLSKREMDLYDK